MLFFSIAFVLGLLLNKSTSTLSNFGNCTFMEFICDVKKCNTAAVKGLQKDPKGDCSAKFNKTFSCVTKTVQICAGNELSQSQIEIFLRQTSFKENFLCLDGGVGIPTMPSTDSPCSNTSSSDGNACMRTFRQKFATDKSDPALCPEFAQAKRCMKNLIHSDCPEELDFDFGDYNPYCANNRDPGATGNDQCTSGTVTSAGIKVALLFPFLLMLFFVKI